MRNENLVENARLPRKKVPINFMFFNKPRLYLFGKTDSDEFHISAVPYDLSIHFYT